MSGVPSRHRCSAGVPSLVGTSLDSGKRAFGVYYTPDSAAQHMASWVLRSDRDHILEPSAGDGIFIGALDREAGRRRLAEVTITAVELDPSICLSELMWQTNDVEVSRLCRDFLA